MLRELTRSDWLSILGIAADAVPRALLLRGTRNLKTQYAAYREYFSDIHEIGTPNALVEDVLVGTLGGLRVAYASVYGGPMASEVVHMFGAVGTPLVVQIGCCGAIADELDAGDLVLVSEAYCGDGASGYYKTDGPLVLAFPDPVELALPGIHVGRVFTTAALFAEGRRDFEDWHARGFSAVDMETAATFAVAEHYRMDRVSLLFAYDNPRRSGHLLLHEGEKSDRRAAGNRRMTELAFKIIRDRCPPLTREAR
jgi:uridine phosphorylase